MSFELKFQRKQPEPVREVVDPIQKNLEDAGVYVIKGHRFDSRLAKIHTAIDKHMAEVSIGGLSETKNWLIVEADITKQELFDTTLPYGVAIDNAQYRAPVDAVLDILTLVKDIALSDANDDNCYIVCIDLIQQAYKMMGKTWKESHVVGDRPLVIHQTVTPGVQQPKPSMIPTSGMGGQQPKQPDMTPVQEVVESSPKQ